MISAVSYEARVHRVMDHIRSNLDGDTSLDTLAKLAHFSPYHFHRIFRATSGETLTAFVQRARLERAAYLMKASPDRSLVTIALECGFSEQSDFSRLFKKRYGVAPSKWDRKSRLDDQGIVDPDAVREAIERTPMNARLVDRPACRLAYVRLRFPFMGDALRVGYQRLTGWLDTKGFDWRRGTLLGMSWDHYETTPLEDVRFDFGFSVGDDIEADDEFAIHELPAVRAVEVYCDGPLSKVAMAWTYLYEDWLPASDYEPADLPGIKRFRRRPDEVGWDVWEVDCSIAVRPKVP